MKLSHALVERLRASKVWLTGGLHPAAGLDEAVYLFVEAVLFPSLNQY
jgi:hypothetical protein